MKKLTLILLTLVAHTAFALPVGNPSDATVLYENLVLCWGDPCDPCQSWENAFNVRFGFYGDYVFNRHIKFAHGAPFDRFRLSTNAGYLILSLNNRLDLFSTLGASSFSIDTSTSSINSGIEGGRAKIDSSTAFSWSAGARLTLLELGDTTLGLETQYFQFKPLITRVSVTDAFGIYTNQHIKYWETQVGLGISHRIDNLVPYAAIKWSNAKAKSTDMAAMAHLKSSKRWGVAIGTTLVACEKASVTAEGRFGDEKALHVNAQIRF